MCNQPLRPTLVLALACLLALLLFLLGLGGVNEQFWERFLLPLALVFLLLILWGTVWLLTQHRQVQAQLARREQELDELVKVRTAALDASEQRFAKIFRASPVGITLSRLADGLYREANDTYLVITGYSREELIGHTSLELGIISRADRAQLMTALREQEHASGVNLAIRTKSGEILDVLYSIEMVEIEGEAWMLTSTVDITAQKRLEVALVAGERKYRDLYDNSPAMYFVGLPTEQIILDCNQTLARALGYTREELIGRPTGTLFTPTSYSQLEAHRTAFLAERKGENFDMQLQCKDGTLLDVLVSGSVEPDPAGGPPMARVTLHDITDRKRLEAQLRDSEERFRLIVQNSPDIIALYGEDGSMVYVSPAIELAHGVSAKRVLDKDPLLIEALTTPPGEGPYPAELARIRALPQFADRRAIAAAVTYCLQHPDVLHRVEVANTLLSGEVRYFDTVYRAHQRAGGGWQVVSITRDTTDRKQLEHALQALNKELEDRVAARTADLQAALAGLQAANQLKDGFMAMISHELRTPLTGVLSLSEMLEEQVAGPLNERQAFYVKGIVTSGERLLNVINGILGYTHLLAGKVRLDAAPCDLAYLLEVCAASCRHKAAAKGQSITVTVVPPDLDLAADATAIAEVLKRLLDNAVKFTPEGGRIGIEACRTPLGSRKGTRPRLTVEPAAAPTVDIVVCDTGIGIPPDQFNHVFHAFTQADSRLSRSHEGIGLGLAYVDQMVRLMGGTLAIESTLGVGSRFTITLPA